MLVGEGDAKAGIGERRSVAERRAGERRSRERADGSQDLGDTLTFGSKEPVEGIGRQIFADAEQ